MVLADMEPQLGSNDILMQIDDLPKNVAKSGSKATKTIISIMKAPITQLGYDPDGPEPLPTGHKHRPKSFERLTHYSFQSGEKMRVKQQNRKDESSDGSMPVDVNFDGDVPNIDEDEFTIDPLEEDLVEESPGKITGYGKSAVNFGKNRRVAFKWEDQITYDSSANDSTPNQQIEAGSTMHIQARANLENDSKALRLQVKVDRFGSCPEGYSKIRDICRDVNECTMVDGICASEAECRNTFGGFECQRVCAKGYQASADGECIDIDECSMGMDECDPTTECLNTEGSYECIESCADGFYHNTENICEDINECQLDDPCTMPMFCENLLGSYKCLCPAGFPLINDTCQGISMDPMKPLKLFEYSAEPEEGNCPSGFTWNGRESLCADVDECAFDAPCQYECSNKAGAFECSCPDGYVLNESGQCTDINECDIDGICEEGELCFNQLGTHSCMRSPCPHRYRLDYKKAQCVPLCRNCTEIPINLHMLAVPRAMSAGSPLIRLSAYDAAGRPLRHTNFEIQEERKYVNGYFAAPLPFYLRTVHGRATLHNQNRLLAGSLHKIPIRSSSKEGGIGHAHKYQTNYLIFVAVSKYPF
ncbi:calcium-binding EGF domain-containing protein [Ditylenchus destructor]|uniref:Calcium-binding EGF domain-containing protein n=1 Tax=Ditylenchus destructor TaxID=166010 RepID=A0AAD4NAK3_9BILA|nr:calcium-binding EGF domain-containing protein [Ditylenchus destructor]